MNQLVYPPRHLRAGALGTGVDDAILLIDEYHLGLVRPRLFVGHVTEARDDREIARTHVMRRRSVHTNDPGPSRPLECVCCEAGPLRDVPDLHLLVFEDAGGIEQVSINRDAPLVVEVGVSNCGSVDLPEEHSSAHVNLRSVRNGYAQMNPELNPQTAGPQLLESLLIRSLKSP